MSQIELNHWELGEHGEKADLIHAKRPMAVRIALAAAILLMATQAAPAQYVISPVNVNPYSRTALGPYLNPQLRPYILPELPPVYAPPGYYSGRMDGPLPPQYAEEWVNRRIDEIRLPATGAPIRFQVYVPYYNLPNQNSLVLGMPQFQPGAGGR